jgi:hypothetical protein
MRVMDKPTEWKAHPVIVALISGAATLGVVVPLFFTVVIPTWMKEKDVEIAELKRQLVSLPQVTEAASKLDKENKELKVRIQEMSKENMFSTEDVYPKGYRAVRVGDPIAMVNEPYAGKTITDEDGWLSVKTDDAVFPSIIYYYGRDAKRGKTVTHIIFQTDLKEETEELIRRQLAEKYGAEKMKETPKRYWELSNVLGYDLKLNPISYTIDRHSNTAESMRNNIESMRKMQREQAGTRK